MEIVCREIRAKISAMAKDRTVLHEAVSQKHFLAAADVFCCENYLAAWIKHSRRNGRRIRISAICKHSEDEKTTQKHD
jgi:hypothetical protein